MDRAVREMTFEEEAAFYRQEVRAVFAKEDPTCEGQEVNNILRRGMRIIRKAEERIAAMQDSKRGQWERLPDNEEWAYCSQCHCCWEWEIINNCNVRYCPNCGAKMDLEVTNGLDQH